MTEAVETTVALHELATQLGMPVWLQVVLGLAAAAIVLDRVDYHRRRIKQNGKGDSLQQTITALHAHLRKQDELIAQFYANWQAQSVGQNAAHDRLLSAVERIERKVE